MPAAKAHEPAPLPVPPRDATIVDVMAALEARGYKGQFAARDGGRIECFACHRLSDAKSVPLQAAHRLEGTSDPADEMVVAALQCPACGSRGTAVFTYGPGAPPEDGEAFRLLQDQRPGAARPSVL